MAARTMMYQIQQGTIETLVDELCSAEVLNGRYLIQMPVLTSIGSLVSVSIWPEGGDSSSFLVSDDGMALHEICTAMASERVFTRVAASKCRQAGAEFDGGSMLFMRVDRDRLKGAVVAMAALTRDVIDETIEKSFAEKVDKAREIFIGRASTAFLNFSRTENATIFGQSSMPYTVDLLIELDEKRLAFDFFSKSGNSVNAAYTKLSDIARSDDGPTPVGVTRRLSEIGPKLTLITSISRVIEAGADVSEYQRLAA